MNFPHDDAHCAGARAKYIRRVIWWLGQIGGVHRPGSTGLAFLVNAGVDLAENPVAAALGQGLAALLARMVLQLAQDVSDQFALAPAFLSAVEMALDLPQFRGIAFAVYKAVDRLLYRLTVH